MKRAFTEEHRRMISESAKMRVGSKNPFYGKKHSSQFVIGITGEGNHQWKGDKVGYAALHDWIEKRISKPDRCPRCGLPKECHECNRKIRLELANITGVYGRDLVNWEYMCTACHRKFDNYTRDSKTGRFLKQNKKRVRL